MLIGMDKHELDTPALWVDLDTMENNIRLLATYFREAGVAWRPHIKGIKVPAIAHKLLRAGAVGITCAKLSEAETMASAGITDILVANQIVGLQKIVRLVYMRRTADVMVAVDDLSNAKQISDMAEENGVTVRVLIEVDVGMHRAGLQPGEAVVRLAKELTKLQGIDLTGVMAWEGHAAPLTDPKEKEQTVKKAIGSLVCSAEMCREAGIDIDIVSCGGSSTYTVTSHIPGVTEIEAGGATFTDVTYSRRGVHTTPAIFLLATVTSRPTSTRAIIDAGRKAMDGQNSMPIPRDLPGATLSSLHAEHGLLDLDGQDVSLGVGDKLDFVIGYGDNTLYQHSTLYGVRGENVESVWEIAARGCLT